MEQNHSTLPGWRHPDSFELFCQGESNKGAAFWESLIRKIIPIKDRGVNLLELFRKHKGKE